MTREMELRSKVAARSENVYDYKELASMLEETFRFEEAISTLRQGLTVPLQDTARAILLTSLAWHLYSIADETAEPIELARQAAELTEGNELCEARAAYASAKALTAEAILQADPESATSIAKTALLLLEDVLATGCPRHPVLASEALIQSARMNCLLERFGEAARRYEQALRSATDASSEFFALTGLGGTYRDDGRLSEARATLMKAVQFRDIPPHWLLAAYYELGLTEMKMGKNAEARAKLQKALGLIQEHPTLPCAFKPDLWRLTGEISYGMGDFEEAARSFEVAARSYPVTDPFHSNCLLWLANSYYELGRLELAQRNAESVKVCPLASRKERTDADTLLGYIKQMQGAGSSGLCG